MRSCISFLLLLFFLNFEFLSAKSVKILSYNIQGHDNNATRTENVAKIINNTKPDFVALQEVDLRFHNYLKDLANATGMHQEFMSAKNLLLPNYGVAILSKTAPISKIEKIIKKGKNSKDKEDRPIFVAEFQEFYFISTHFSLDDIDRDAASDYLVNFAKTATKPVFVAGDFNAKANYRAMNTLKNNGFVILNDENVITFPPTKNEPKGACIDFILAYTPEGVRNKFVNPVALVGNAPADVDLLATSDHYPLEVTVGNPVTDVASLRNTVSKATPTGISEVSFNVASGSLDFTGEGVININGKKINFNGPVEFKNGTTLFSLNNASEIGLKDITVSGFSGIAVKVAGNSIANVENCSLINNGVASNANNGSAIRVSSSTLNMTDSYIKNNISGGEYGGGAICAFGASVFNADACTFEGNEALSGGALSFKATDKNASPIVKITNCTFANNTSNDRAGAIYLQTETTTDVFAPQIINCTFVNNKSVKAGGAINAWSKATTTMKPVLINNLFAGNYHNGNVANDVWAYYLAGAKTPSVFPTCSNNVYVVAQENFFGTKDKKVAFEGLFKTTSANGVELQGDGSRRVAMIAKTSPANGAGTASFSGVEIPTVDQLGVKRLAKPSVGAVEFEERTIVVTDIASLREAVAAASNVGNTEILFNVPNGVLDFTNEGVIDIRNKNITFEGPVTFENGKTLFSLLNKSKVTFNNIKVKRFTDIAVKVNDSEYTIKNSLFKNNGNLRSSFNGGAMRINGGIVKIEDSMFDENKCGGYYGGGALCVYGPSDLKIMNSSFVGNKSIKGNEETGALRADGGGGAISVGVPTDPNSAKPVAENNNSVAAPKVYISNTTFSGNETNYRGGAIYMMHTLPTSTEFAPVVVNCTFVNNYSAEVGGAVCLWEKKLSADVKLSSKFVNNLFGANYQHWGESNQVQNDVHGYYLKGASQQTVFPTCISNLYTSQNSAKFFEGDTNQKVTEEEVFNKVNNITAQDSNMTYKYVQDKSNNTGESDDRTCTVVMIRKDGPADKKGVLNFAGVMIPTVDQLGRLRNSSPSIGAVEYNDDVVTGVETVDKENSELRIWSDGNQLHFNGLEENVEMQIFDLAGKQVYYEQTDGGSAITIELEKGIYIVRAGGKTTKVLVR